MPNQTYELRTLDPVLTTLAQGYVNRKYVGKELFPVVEVSKQKGRIPVFGKSAFVERSTERAMGSNSNRLPQTEFDLLEFETIERDVEMAVDYLEEEQIQDFYKYEQYTVSQLIDILELNCEIEAAKIATNPDNYPSDNKIIIDETSSLNLTYNSTEIIKEAIERVRSSIGVHPNTMIMSYPIYQIINNDIVLQDRFKYAGITSLNTKIISDFFEIPKVKIATTVFPPDGTSFENVWGNSIILAFVDDSSPELRNEFNPSFGYTLRRRGMPEIDTYYENGGKIKVVRATDNYCLKMTSPQAGCLILNQI
ncbi:MAG TPA: hypothetical protein PLU67_05265 [Candidatus Kapabacteria bacterium]|nr:hypothetical protein [Candidatus Kapabacteria bacterium]